MCHDLFFQPELTHSCYDIDTLCCSCCYEKVGLDIDNWNWMLGSAGFSRALPSPSVAARSS